MTQVFAAILAPVKPWRLQGVETARTFELVTACGLAYNTGSPDILPAGTAAAVAGGGVVMDLTAADYVIYTVQGSNTLSATTEATVPPAGTYALLWRVTLQGVDLYQQAGGSGGGGGGIAPFSWKIITADYTITTSDTGIAVDASGGPVVISVPTAVGAVQAYCVKRVDTVYSNTVTIAPVVGGETLEFLASLTLAVQGHSLVFGSDNSNWLVTSSHYPNPGTTLGDGVFIDANGVPQRLPVGAAGTKITSNPVAALAVDYE